MARALGIGGVFFKCRDRDRLAAWYAEALGLEINEFGGAVFPRDDLPPSAYSVWGPFAQETDYFRPSRKGFMLNLIVDNLDAALAQVVAAGGRQVGTIEDYDYGRFGWFVDPDGNKIELWQPAAAPG